MQHALVSSSGAQRFVLVAQPREALQGRHRVRVVEVLCRELREARVDVHFALSVRARERVLVRASPQTCACHVVRAPQPHEEARWRQRPMLCMPPDGTGELKPNGRIPRDDRFGTGKRWGRGNGHV